MEAISTVQLLPSSAACLAPSRTLQAPSMLSRRRATVVPPRAVPVTCLRYTQASSEERTVSRRSWLAASTTSLSAILFAASLPSPAFAVPRPPADDPKYQEETRQLIADIRKEIDMDLLDPERGLLVADVKKRILDYNGRLNSGRLPICKSSDRMIIGLNALQGHYAFKGLAPLPASLRNTILKEFDSVEKYLAENK